MVGVVHVAAAGALAAIFLCPVTSSAIGDGRGDGQRAGAGNMSYPAVPPGHPRVYMRPADLAGLRHKTQSRESRKLWQFVTNRKSGEAHRHSRALTPRRPRRPPDVEPPDVEPPHPRQLDVGPLPGIF